MSTSPRNCLSPASSPSRESREGEAASISHACEFWSVVLPYPELRARPPSPARGGRCPWSQKRGIGRSSEAGGLGRKRSCCCLLERREEEQGNSQAHIGRGQEEALPNLGGESQRSLYLPETWAPHPGGKGYQGGKWGTRKPSPPTSKKEEEACSNIQRRAKHLLSWHRIGQGQGPGPLQPSGSPAPGEQCLGLCSHHLGKDKLSIGTRLQLPTSPP